MLDQLDVAVAPTRPQAPGRARECEPHPSPFVLEQEHFTTRPFEPDAGRNDAGVIDDGELARELGRQIGEGAMADGTARTLVDEQPGGVPPLGRVLCDQLPRKVVVECRRLHPLRTLFSSAVDEKALERAKARIAEAANGRVAPSEVEAALERARTQIEALAEATAQLEGTLPEKIGAAVHDGLRTEVLPVARNLAEIRGLLNQAIRRLERLEGDILAERHARIDDLALLVDLVSSGWKGVSDRLDRMEDANAPQYAALRNAG